MLKTRTHTHDWDLGGLAQLARAPALHAGGQRFESVILHLRSPKRATGDVVHVGCEGEQTQNAWFCKSGSNSK